jgi:hypothetical protein
MPSAEQPARHRREASRIRVASWRRPFEGCTHGSAHLSLSRHKEKAAMAIAIAA